MRIEPIALLCAAMMVVTVSGCSKGRDRCGADYRYHTLGDVGDCPHRQWYKRQYREFFDPGDFGRGRDSLYGNAHNRRDEDYSRYDGDFCCGRHRYGNHAHAWRHRSWSNEDEVSERYAPPMAPDTEYDE